MFSGRTGLRLGVLLLVLVTLFVPFGVGAGSAVDCGDFANPDAAQALLDSDDSYADALDPDGDGVACNEDAGDDDAVASDAGYLDAVGDEVGRVGESIDHFFDVMMSANGADQAETTEIAEDLNEIAATWAAYPDEAPVFDAPTHYADIDALYLEWVDSVGETGEDWQHYWVLAISESDEDHTDALEAFDASVVVTRDYADQITALIEEAAADADDEDAPAADDEDDEDEPRDDSSTGDAEYLDDVVEEVDAISDSFVTFMETYGYAAEDTTTGDDFETAIDELTALAAMWAAYPDEAPAFDVPAGYEEIDDAYQVFVTSVGETGEAWQAYWDAPGDDDALFDAFNEAYVAAQDDAFAVIELVSAAEGEESGDAGDDNAPSDDDAGDDMDAAAYLDAVRTHFDQLVTSYNRFNDILDAGEFTAADEEEIQDIYLVWADARSIAADIEAPEGYEEIHEAYLAVANGFSESYELYAAWINTESGSEEEDDALAAYEESVTELNELCLTLDELLRDADA